MCSDGFMVTLALPCEGGSYDYVDSHKNVVWQEYTAATTAGLTKELLSIVKPAEGARPAPHIDARHLPQPGGGALYVDQGKLDAAEMMYSRALGPDTP